MLKLYNTLGRKLQTFRPDDGGEVTIFTCGPSVYQRSHIGNFRTFLFEDLLVRYLEFSGYRVTRGMNFTDVEDKAIEESEREGIGLKELTDRNIAAFMHEMALLRIKRPDFLPRASECVKQAVSLIKRLLDIGAAYRSGGDIYFDPLKARRFGELYGLDMSKWPKRKRRFHKDTYPGNRWNLGDFILWHGDDSGGSVYWETEIGRGRPSWNIQDPAMVSRYFGKTLSIYCGGIDNLFRHHDYTKAILETARPYPAARYWLHCHHLYVGGKKMSKSRGNIYYTGTVMKRGYGPDEVRFFLINGHYRRVIDYSEEAMKAAAGRLREFRSLVNEIGGTRRTRPEDTPAAARIKEVFTREMDNDLDVGSAFRGVREIVSEAAQTRLSKGERSGIIRALREIDEVLKVIF